MFTLFLLLQCSSMLYSIGVQEEIRGKSIDEQNTLGKLDPIANLSDNRLENIRANGEEEHINVAPGARAGVDHDLILQEVVLCRSIYCCYFWQWVLLVFGWLFVWDIDCQQCPINNCSNRYFWPGDSFWVAPESAFGGSSREGALWGALASKQFQGLAIKTPFGEGRSDVEEVATCPLCVWV